MKIKNASEHSPGYERLSTLFDEGTFVELGAYIRRKDRENEYEGVICGYGSVNSRLVFAFAQDPDRLGGALDAYHADKIEALYRAAMRSAAPVIGILNSKGAMIGDGISSVAAYGRIIKCVSDASGIIPQLAIIDGVCAGSMAAIAQMFDITVAVRDKTLLYVTSPSAIGDTYGKAETVAALGLVGAVSEDSEGAIELARRIVCMLPDNSESLAVSESADSAERESITNGGVYENISSLTDTGSFVELYKEYGESMVTGLATIAGVTVGIVANDPSKDLGRITPNGARKAARLISFCDSFSIPTVTLTDSYGVKASKDSEDVGISAAMAKLAMAYTASTNAKITLIIGNAYGAAAILMGSKAMGTDLVLACPEACVGTLSPEASVAFIDNSLVGKEGSREELEERWRRENLSPVKAAEVGEIDDIIEPSEARARIASALYMLSDSNRSCKRKHTVDPL